jgi:hypothetical protein
MVRSIAGILGELTRKITKKITLLLLENTRARLDSHPGSWCTMPYIITSKYIYMSSYDKFVSLPFEGAVRTLPGTKEKRLRLVTVVDFLQMHMQ